MNLSSLLFYTTLIAGTLISISSSSWLIMWIGLEMNLMSFVPIINKDKTPYESEASMKYFLIQAMASMMLLAAVLSAEMMNDINNWQNLILISALLMKMGAAPFHLWFPNVMQGLSWINCFTLMTWQKIAPMVMTSYQLFNNKFINMIIILSVIVGAVGGMNQTSIRKMMAYSSISHIGWMLTAMLMSSSYWMLYFIMYIILNMAVIMIMNKYAMFQLQQIFNTKMETTTKFTMFTGMLSLAGLPPFLGFLPKWMIIQNMIMFQEYLVIMIMVMTTLITLYFYLRMMYSAFTLSNQSGTMLNENKNKTVLMISISISLLGIPLISMINLY
uniref:NADH-ubiquinone oxidoreductase chain 2 n=1 Tax=Euphaea yayeyamana TaxID=543830 RepID=A0A0A7A843_9ODON|nr:NADH dehydrogenase subunit 2 [Euphaea yayeyamana]AHC02112.1 NADH dehydrogenase subunit 2 [Euphaea yayeyamana]